MKGAVDLITIIIVACIVVSIGLVLWFYLSVYYWQVSQAGGARTQRSLETLSSCMRIEEATQNKFFIRNCGTGLVTNDSLNVYIDDNRFSFSLDPASIDAGKTGTLSLQGASALSIGQHTLRITNPNFETSALFESKVPDSCILALDFDEGSGNITYDSSGYHNDGILIRSLGQAVHFDICSGGLCPQWVDGKFGKALKCDAISGNYIGDNVLVPYSTSLDVSDAITVELWVKLSTIHQTSGDYPRFIYRDGVDDNNIAIDLSFENASKEVIFGFMKNTATHNIQAYGSPLNTPNRWYHILASYDKDVGTNNMNIYIDGSLINSVTNNMGTIPTGKGSCGSSGTCYGDLAILGAGDWGFINGTVDSVRIFNKALTPDQTLNFRLI